MSSTLARQVHDVIAVVDPRGTRGRRLQDNSARLCALVQHLLTLNLIPTPADTEALDLACAALQLTARHAPGPDQQQRQAMTLRDRAESAAELLISSTEPADPNSPSGVLLDRTVRLLRQMPERSPTAPEARILADAVNLEDFGVTGLMTMMTQVAVAGDGVSQFLDACTTREHYGYWDARLARFHFPPARQMAERRLASARQVYNLLRSELPGSAPAK